MAGRVAAILDRLEKTSSASSVAASGALELPPLTYFDRTCWRRRPPTDLTDGKPKSLGDRLRQRRLELGLSQEQLGRRFGVGRVTLYRWERGACDPPASRRESVTAFLGSRRRDDRGGPTRRTSP